MKIIFSSGLLLFFIDIIFLLQGVIQDTMLNFIVIPSSSFFFFGLLCSVTVFFELLLVYSFSVAVIKYFNKSNWQEKQYFGSQFMMGAWGVWSFTLHLQSRKGGQWTFLLSWLSVCHAPHNPGTGNGIPYF